MRRKHLLKLPQPPRKPKKQHSLYHRTILWPFCHHWARLRTVCKFASIRAEKNKWSNSAFFVAFNASRKANALSIANFGCTFRTPNLWMLGIYAWLEWLDLNNILIPDLREAIQPANINQQFFRLWKRKLGSRTQSWGTVRALPKQKNLSLGRPLGDQSCNPLSLLCRILARFLDLCLAEFLDSSHFDRPTHASVIRSLLQIREQPFGDDFLLPKLCNYGVYIMSRDVDNGYMRIQHPEALQA